MDWWAFKEVNVSFIFFFLIRLLCFISFSYELAKDDMKATIGTYVTFAISIPYSIVLLYLTEEHTLGIKGWSLRNIDVPKNRKLPEIGKRNVFSIIHE